MLLSLIVHSQHVTDSIVVLPKSIAIRVLQDLERLDQCDSEIALEHLKIEKLINQTRVQDRVILGQQEQLFNLKAISSNKDSIILVNDNKVKYWNKQYKKQKRQKFLVGGIGLLLIFLVGF